MLRSIGEKLGIVPPRSVANGQNENAFSAYEKREQIDGQMEKAYDRAVAEAMGERRLIKIGDSGLSGDAQSRRLEALHRKLNEYDDRFRVQLEETGGMLNFTRDLGWLQREALRLFWRSGSQGNKVLDVEALRSAINDGFGAIVPEREFGAAVEVLRLYVTKGEVNGKKLA